MVVEFLEFLEKSCLEMELVLIGLEQLLPEPRKSLDALRKGKVDMLDRLLPVDALRLQLEECRRLVRDYPVDIPVYIWAAFVIIMVRGEDYLLARLPFFEFIWAGPDRVARELCITQILILKYVFRDHPHPPAG